MRQRQQAIGRLISSTNATLPSASAVAPGTQRYVTDIGGGVVLQSNGVTWNPVVAQNPNYFFHGFAGNQINGDTSFYDISSNFNNAAFGAELLSSTAFGTTGYATTLQPASFTGSLCTIAGTVLTAGGTIGGTIQPGMKVTGTSVTAGTYITSYSSGTGGAGTYNLSASSTVSVAESMTFNGIDPVLRMPNLDFDYTGGQKLVMWWLGTGTAPGSNVQFIGDGDSATYHGVSVRCTASTGTVQLLLRDGNAAAFGGTGAIPILNGSLNSFAIVIDGQNKKYCQWANEAVEAAFGSAYSTFNSGTATDTTNSNTFNIGQPEPASAVSSGGMALQTRAFVMFRLSSTMTTPSVATFTSVFKQLRANPGKLITNSAF